MRETSIKFFFIYKLFQIYLGFISLLQANHPKYGIVKNSILFNSTEDEKIDMVFITTCASLHIPENRDYWLEKLPLNNFTHVMIRQILIN